MTGPATRQAWRPGRDVLRPHRAFACAVCLAIAGASCSNGGVDPAEQRTEPATGLKTDSLGIVSHTPDDGAVQVPVDSDIVVELDGLVALESLQEPETGLRKRGDANALPGTITTTHTGHGFVFHPASPLREETDYVFSLSAFTSDVDGRLLDTSWSVSFRTLDERPPRFVDADLVNGATGESRSRTWTLTADDDLDPTSVDATTVRLRDALGNDWPLRLETVGRTIRATPLADLAGNRPFVLGVLGTRDRAGNRQTEPLVRTFATATDTTPPRMLETWPLPGAAIAPKATLTITFDESIDPARPIRRPSWSPTRRPGAARALSVSTDRRSVGIRRGTASPSGSLTSSTCRSGKGAVRLERQSTPGGIDLPFTVSADDRPPRSSSSAPRTDANAVPGPPSRRHLRRTDRHRSDRPADGVAGRPRTARRFALASILARDGDRTLEAVPATPLAARTELRAAARRRRTMACATSSAIRSTAPHPLHDHQGCHAAGRLLFPAEGAANVAPESCVVAIADSPLDTASVDATTFVVRTSDGVDVPGTRTVERDGRVRAIRSRRALVSGRWIRRALRGGPDGVREPSGNWLPRDVAQLVRRDRDRRRDRAAAGGDARRNRRTAQRRSRRAAPRVHDRRHGHRSGRGRARSVDVRRESGRRRRFPRRRCRVPHRERRRTRDARHDRRRRRAATGSLLVARIGRRPQRQPGHGGGDPVQRRRADRVRAAVRTHPGGVGPVRSRSRRQRPRRTSRTTCSDSGCAPTETRAEPTTDGGARS